MLVKEQEDRWEIVKLLEHPFLVNASKEPFMGTVEKVLNMKSQTQVSNHVVIN